MAKKCTKIQNSPRCRAIVFLIKPIVLQRYRCRRRRRCLSFLFMSLVTRLRCTSLIFFQVLVGVMRRQSEDTVYTVYLPSAMKVTSRTFKIRPSAVAILHCVRVELWQTMSTRLHTPQVSIEWGKMSRLSLARC